MCIRDCMLSSGIVKQQNSNSCYTQGQGSVSLSKPLIAYISSKALQPSRMYFFCHIYQGA